MECNADQRLPNFEQLEPGIACEILPTFSDILIFYQRIPYIVREHMS